MWKQVLLALAGALLLAAIGVAVYVQRKVSAFESSMAKKYDVPLQEVTRSEDPVVLARGKHLAEGLGGCMTCHGPDLAGGKVEDFGPMGRIRHPNITGGKNGLPADYTDAELVRLLRHGLHRDGTSVVFMPATDTAWWPMEDTVALVSWFRTVPPVDGAPGSIELGALAKVLDQLDMITFDVARRIDHSKKEAPPAPQPTVEYGAFVARLCQGCHGSGLSGGPIPGAPSSLAVPTNLTPHQTGLAGWTYEDFEKTLRQGLRKDGKQLDPFMPVEATRNFDDNELRGLYNYLQSLPPKAFGGR